MKKEQHTAIWKNIIKISLNRLEFLYEEYNFSKPTKSKFRDETYIFLDNYEFEIYTTIYDGDLIPPIFKIKNKETNEIIEIERIDEKPKISNNKEIVIYLDRIESLIRKFLEKIKQ